MVGALNTVTGNLTAGQRTTTMGTGIAQALGLTIFATKQDEILPQATNLERLVCELFTQCHGIPEINVHRTFLISGQRDQPWRDPTD